MRYDGHAFVVLADRVLGHVPSNAAPLIIASLVLLGGSSLRLRSAPKAAKAEKQSEAGECPNV
jgi:hypothetical protein